MEVRRRATAVLNKEGSRGFGRACPRRKAGEDRGRDRCRAGKADRAAALRDPGLGAASRRSRSAGRADWWAYGAGVGPRSRAGSRRYGAEQRVVGEGKMGGR